AEPFIAAEVERTVLDERAPEVRAELLAVEQRLRRDAPVGPSARRVEVVARVEAVVAVEVERLAVYLVRARPRGDVDDRPGIPAVLGAERRVVHLEFRDRVDRRLE